MARLQILTQFKETFENVKTLLDNYNNNLRNELFEIDLNEDNQQLYQRGETIYDQCEDDLNNLKEVLEKEKEIEEFFDKCRENKEKLIEEKNEIINKLLRIKKNKVTKEEYYNLRDFWNNKREETPDVKNRRECEEMLEEMKEEKKYIEEMTKRMESKGKELEEIIDNSIVLSSSENGDPDVIADYVFVYLW